MKEHDNVGQLSNNDIFSQDKFYAGVKKKINSARNVPIKRRNLFIINNKTHKNFPDDFFSHNNNNEVKNEISTTGGEINSRPQSDSNKNTNSKNIIETKEEGCLGSDTKKFKKTAVGFISGLRATKITNISNIPIQKNSNLFSPTDRARSKNFSENLNFDCIPEEDEEKNRTGTFSMTNKSKKFFEETTSSGTLINPSISKRLSKEGFSKSFRDLEEKVLLKELNTKSQNGKKLNELTNQIKKPPLDIENKIENKFNSIRNKGQLDSAYNLDNKFNNLRSGTDNSGSGIKNKQVSPIKIDFNSEIRDKSSDGNEASTSGSIHIPKKKIESIEQIFRYDVIENNDYFKQTACFSQDEKSNSNIYKDRNKSEKNFGNKKSNFIINLNYSNNTEKANIINSPIGFNNSQISFYSPKVDKEKEFKKENSKPNEKRSFSREKSEKKLLNYTNTYDIHPVRHFSPRVQSLSTRNLNKENKKAAEYVLPAISSHRNPKKINSELNNIFDAAEVFKEDPDVKNKIENLLQNIIDIKNVLKLKTKNRIKISSAPNLFKTNNNIERNNIDHKKSLSRIDTAGKENKVIIPNPKNTKSNLSSKINNIKSNIVTLNKK